jgi:hypothetical protein
MCGDDKMHHAHDELGLSIIQDGIKSISNNFLKLLPIPKIKKLLEKSPSKPFSK